MKTFKITKKILKRLKKLNFMKVACISYILFSVFFTVFALNYNEKINSSSDIDVNEKMNKENNIVSNYVEENKTILNANISPLNLNISYIPLNKTNSNDLNLDDNISQNNFEEVTTENIEIDTTLQNVIDSTITEETTVQNEISINNIDQSTEPIIDSNFTLDEYINYLINYYSSYNTRIELNYDNIYLLGRISRAESEGECLEGKIGVCEVVINRSVTRNQTLYQVIYSKNNNGVPQFSCTIDGRINLTPMKEDILAAVKAILGEQPTDGSIYFDNPNKAPNSWASRNMKKSVKIGNHQFYYNLPKE